MGTQREYYEFMGYPAGELAFRYRGYADRLAGRGPVLDVGCGRGEFLALLAERGAEAVGIDLDAEMVAEVRARGFNAEVSDAIEFLRAHEGHFGGIFCAHVVEHLPADAMVELVRTAAGALRPGGRLIAVTPNPHSLESHLYEFWTDLQHVRFYTPDILRWVLFDAGLQDVEAADNPDYRSGRELKPGPPSPPVLGTPPPRAPGPALGALARMRQWVGNQLEPASALERMQALEDRVRILEAEAAAVPQSLIELTDSLRALFPPGEFYVTGVR